MEESWRGVVESYYLDDDGDCRTEIQVVDPCHVRDSGWWAMYQITTCGHTDISEHMIAGTGAMNVLMTCMLRATACRIWWLPHSLAVNIQNHTNDAKRVISELHTKMYEYSSKESLLTCFNYIHNTYSPISVTPTFPEDLFQFTRFCTKHDRLGEDEGAYRYVDYQLSDDHVPAVQVPEPPSMEFISYLAFPPREIGNKATVSFDLPPRARVSFDNGSIVVPCTTIQSMPNPLPYLCSVTEDGCGPLAGKVLITEPLKGDYRVY